MKRRIAIKLCIFLLLGAVVNVAVAWGFVIRAAQMHHTDMWACDLMALTRTAGSVGEWSTEVHADGGYTMSRRRVGPLDVAYEDFTTVAFQYQVTHFRETNSSERKAAAGWPDRSLMGRPTQFSGSVRPVVTIVRDIRNPIWPGFAINTLFYTAMLWLLFAFPFKLRRWRRIRRGLCAKCAYPVGASDVCTECGTVILRKSRPAALKSDSNRDRSTPQLNHAA